jgi:hypothetical protein
MFKIYTNLYINKKNKWSKNNTIKSMPNLFKYRYKNFKTLKALPNWIRKKKTAYYKRIRENISKNINKNKNRGVN